MPNGSEGRFWVAPGVDLEKVLGDAQHLMMDGFGDVFASGSEPEFEVVVATEDDFEDDCPICQMMRKRVRNGERIEITKLKASGREEAH